MNGGGSGGGGGGMTSAIGSAFGGILDAFGNMTKAHNQKSLALKQSQGASSLTSTAANTTAPALQKEFTDALQTKQELAANGISNIDKYNNDLDQHLADSVATAKQAGGSGDSLLATLSSLGHSSDASHLSLDEQDAQARNANKSNLVNTMWQIGAEKDNNDAIKRAQQDKLNAQAGALSNASTINSYQAANKITDSTTGLLANVYNLASSIATGGMGGGGAKAGTQGGDRSGENAGDNNSYYSNRVDGPDAAPGDGSDNTNLSGSDTPININSGPSNMNWGMGMGG